MNMYCITGKFDGNYKLFVQSIVNIKLVDFNSANRIYSVNINEHMCGKYMCTCAFSA